jgi:hypothetical protein
VGAHGREQEWLRSLITQPIAGRPRNLGNIGDSAASGRNPNITPWHFQAEAIELFTNRPRNICKGIGHQLLMNA